MKVAILSNVNTDWLIQELERDHEVYQPVGEGNWVRDLVEPGSAMEGFDPRAVFVILDGHELIRGCDGQTEVAATLDEARSYIDTFALRCSATHCFISSIDLPQIEIFSLKENRMERFAEIQWFWAIDRLSQQHRSCCAFDLKELIEREGREKFYSSKLMYSGHIPYSIRGHRLIVQRIKQCLKAVAGQRRKLLIVDLDNTLWGGVLGEQGTDGIELGPRDTGAAYQDFQRRLLNLKDTGVILAIVSKNTESNVQDVFDQNVQMVLSLNDFVTTRINWDLKPINIRDIVETLNIGMDAVVFVDDSPLERELAKEQLPDLAVPEFPKDAAQLSDWIRDVYFEHFLTLDTTAEDDRKTELYQESLTRESHQRQATTYEEFLESLATIVKVRHAKPSDAPRISQLTHKTNQFNLTTRRYSEAEVIERIQDKDCWVVVCEVEDRFGSSGQVSVMIISRNESIANLDTFLLSCRVMSRFIEDSILTAVEDFLATQGISTVTASYLPTAKNGPVESLMERLGYDQTSKSPDGAKEYQFVITSTRPPQRQFVATLQNDLENSQTPLESH